MGKNKSWIPIDKDAVYHLPKDRIYSNLEALFSYTLDSDNGKKISLSAYSKMWTWSRTKVRNFIKMITENREQIEDSRRTDRGHPIAFIGKGLWDSKNRKETDREQIEDRHTYNPKPNPKEKKRTLPEKVFSDEVKSICNIFSQNVDERFWPKNETQKNKWRKAIDDCNRIDKYDYEKIEEIIIHFRNDTFWQDKFLSPLKLQKKNGEGIKYIDYFWNKMSAEENGTMDVSEKKALANNRKRLVEMGKSEAEIKEIMGTQ